MGGKLTVPEILRLINISYLAPFNCKCKINDLLFFSLYSKLFLQRQKYVCLGHLLGRLFSRAFSYASSGIVPLLVPFSGALWGCPDLLKRTGSNTLYVRIRAQ